ncbi:MAG: hypothetical protein J7K63_00630 [Candidatus Marinimicrobia bacterium]|nr:hypothetical protein [Candidatus Neomarinimicrobiota bacterium]
MKSLEFKVELLSDTLPGSGSSGGVVIDTDVAADEFGFPYLPAKRLKGLFLESACEVLEMAPDLITPDDIERIFGKSGNAESHSVIVGDGLLEGMEETTRWIRSVVENNADFNKIFHSEPIKEIFTITRRQTKIDPETGTAEKHSLRTFRVLKRGLVFEGTIHFRDDSHVERDINLLNLIVRNTCYMGTGRNRGYGHVKMTLFKDGHEMNPAESIAKLEKGGVA